MLAFWCRGSGAISLRAHAVLTESRSSPKSDLKAMKMQEPKNIHRPGCGSVRTWRYRHVTLRFLLVTWSELLSPLSTRTLDSDGFLANHNAGLEDDEKTTTERTACTARGQLSPESSGYSNQIGR